MPKTNFMTLVDELIEEETELIEELIEEEIKPIFKYRREVDKGIFDRSWKEIQELEEL